MARSLVHPNLRATLQVSAEGLMPDTCVVLTYGTGRDTDNQETTQTWTPGITFICSFLPQGSQEAGTNQVTTQDRLRLPLSAAGIVASRARIRLTKRYGVDLSPALDYMIDGEPLVGLAAITVQLQRVTT